MPLRTRASLENRYWVLLKQILMGLKKKRGLLASWFYVERQHFVCMSASRVHRPAAQHNVDAEAGVADQVVLRHVGRQSIARANERAVKESSAVHDFAALGLAIVSPQNQNLD
jgi:hypothetical protein